MHGDLSHGCDSWIPPPILGARPARLLSLAHPAWVDRARSTAAAFCRTDRSSSRFATSRTRGSAAGSSIRRIASSRRNRPCVGASCSSCSMSGRAYGSEASHPVQGFLLRKSAGRHELGHGSTGRTLRGAVTASRHRVAAQSASRSRWDGRRRGAFSQRLRGFPSGDAGRMQA